MRAGNRLVPFLVPLLIAGVAAPAGAQPERQRQARLAATADISAPPGVLYDDCVDHPVRYTVTADPPDATWQLNVDTADPTGARGGGNYRSNSFGDPAAGTVGVQMCGAVPGAGHVHAQRRAHPRRRQRRPGAALHLHRCATR